MVAQIKAHDEYVLECERKRTEEEGCVERKLKVYEQSGYRYKPTPTIILKGNWLNEMGFHFGDQITVQCESGKLTILEQ